MSNELKQLNNLRRQAAKIRSYLLCMDKVPGMLPHQYEAVRAAHIAFNMIRTIRMCEKRIEYNDDDPSGFDNDLDGYTNSLDCPHNADIIVRSIFREVHEFKKLAEFECNLSSDPLLRAISDFQCFELNELKFAFTGDYEKYNSKKYKDDLKNWGEKNLKPWAPLEEKAAKKYEAELKQLNIKPQSTPRSQRVQS